MQRCLRILLLTLLTTLMLAGIALLLGSYKSKIVLNLYDGAYVTFSPPSIWESFFSKDPTCRAEINLAGKPAESLLFWQDYADRPVTVTGPYKDGSILCLYDFDIDLRLLKILPGEKAIPFGRASDLSVILYSSSCRVEVADIGDWETMYSALTSLSKGSFNQGSIPIYNLGGLEIHAPLKSIQKDIAEQIALMRKYNAKEWPVPNR